MEIITEEIQLSTNGHSDIHDITQQIADLLSRAKLETGQVTVFSIGSTGGITTLEYEPGLAKMDVRQMLNKIAPYNVNYAHNQTWGDDNGAAHLRSALFGTSYTIPFKSGKMMLGTWQQVVFMDFDTRPRQRKIVVQIVGK